MTLHTDCHAAQQQQPSLAQRVYAARNRRRQSGGPLVCKYLTDGATWAQIR